jgi:hypothetical protein
VSNLSGEKFIVGSHELAKQGGKEQLVFSQVVCADYIATDDNINSFTVISKYLRQLEVTLFITTFIIGKSSIARMQIF